MIITREIDYAVRILRKLQDGQIHNMSTIARDELIPRPFAYKIIKKLDQAGYVTVTFGAHGGYRLVTDLRDHNVYELIECLGGRTLVSACMREGYQCEWCDQYGQCRVSENLRTIQRQMDDILKQCSIHDLLGAGEQVSSNAEPAKA